MIDWTDPDPFQLHALHEALRFAYPRPADFAAFLYFKLDKNYVDYVPNHGYYNDLLELLLQARAGGWLAPLVQKALQDKPASPKLVVLKNTLALAPVEAAQARGADLEDMLRTGGLTEDLIPWLERLGKLGKQTCRVEYPLNSPKGSGWLVGPDLMLTNWHVIDDALPGGQHSARDYVCRFDYAVTAGGAQGGTEVRFAEDWCVDASPPSTAELGTGNAAPSADTLDHALVRLAAPVGKADGRGWVQLQGNEALPKEGDIVLVLQYPDGLPLKLALGDVDAGAADGLRLFHTANTSKGSSGSLVVNAALSPLALHHAGDLLYHRGRIGAPEKNQAIPIGRIAQRLKAAGRL